MDEKDFSTKVKAATKAGKESFPATFELKFKIPQDFSASHHHEDGDGWAFAAGEAICEGAWPGWPPSPTYELLNRALSESGATEGTLWLYDKQELRPHYHQGPHAEVFLQEIRRPLSEGLIGMVFATGLSFAREESLQDRPRRSSIDLRFRQKMHAFAAAPVYFGHRCRGVLSAVTLQSDGGDISPIKPLHLAPLELGATVWGQEIDRLIDAAWSTRLGGEG